MPDHPPRRLPGRVPEPGTRLPSSGHRRPVCRAPSFWRLPVRDRSRGKGGFVYLPEQANKGIVPPCPQRVRCGGVSRHTLAR